MCRSFSWWGLGRQAQHRVQVPPCIASQPPARLAAGRRGLVTPWRRLAALLLLRQGAQAASAVEQFSAPVLLSKGAARGPVCREGPCGLAARWRQAQRRELRQGFARPPNLALPHGHRRSQPAIGGYQRGLGRPNVRVSTWHGPPPSPVVSRALPTCCCSASGCPGRQLARLPATRAQGRLEVAY